METIQLLLAEDNETDAELAVAALRNFCPAQFIEHVVDGPEVLDYLFGTGKYAEKKPALPKLILLDLKLPKLTGLEVLKIVKSHEDTKHIPIVMLTSSKQESDVQTAYALGVNSYIVKPVGFEKYMEVLKSVGQYWMMANEPALRREKNTV